MFQKKSFKKIKLLKQRNNTKRHPLFSMWLWHKLSKHQVIGATWPTFHFWSGPPLLLSFHPLIWHPCVHKRENYLHAKKRCPSEIETAQMGESEMPTQISSPYRWGFCFLFVFFFFFLNFKTVHFLFRNDNIIRVKLRKIKHEMLEMQIQFHELMTTSQFDTFFCFYFNKLTAKSSTSLEKNHLFVCRRGTSQRTNPLRRGVRTEHPNRFDINHHYPATDRIILNNELVYHSNYKSSNQRFAWYI